MSAPRVRMQARGKVFQFLILFAVARPCISVQLETDNSGAGVGRDVKGDTHGLRCLSYGRRNMHKYVTAIVTSSMHPQDANGTGLEMLKEAVQSVRKTLGLSKAQIVVAFDGMKQAEMKSPAAKAYVTKVLRFSEWNHRELADAVTIFGSRYQESEWTHRAELVHRTFEFLESQGKLTPMVYLAPDTGAAVGNVDVPMILYALGCLPNVNLVKFLWADDCSEKRSPGRNMPCEVHTELPLLHSLGWMTGRPHFATTSFYLKEVFPKIPRDYRGQIEKKVPGAKNAWTYGERHMMLHDKELPWRPKPLEPEAAPAPPQSAAAAPAATPRVSAVPAASETPAPLADTV